MKLPKLGWDSVIYGVLALATWLFMIMIDGFDLFVDFAANHESWELDEAFLGLLTLGLFGFLFATQRHRQARLEIKRREIAESNISWIAKHDVLTRLPNRRFLQNFTKQKSKAILHQNPKGFFVYSIDLDGFKKVNDLLGHAGGDELLIECGRRLKDLYDDALVIRLGGDEFLMLIEPEGNADPLKQADFIHEALCQPMQISNLQRHIDASIGISVFPDDTGDLEEAIRYADIAMYVAKKNGEPFTQFRSGMLSLLKEKADLEEAFRSALKNDEIVPHYQPLIDLGTGRIQGFEALARWTHNSLGSIPPTVFIPLAEEIGLIGELSNRLFERACLDATQWPADITLSFNLSPTELTDKALSNRLLQTLSKTGLDARRLEIEITENVLIQDLATATSILADIHAAGIRIALDDFGTGYSNLAQVSNLQFDRIKIDRSLLAGFVENERQKKVVEAIITFGKGLGVPMTAEGIETVGQATQLQNIGCACGQGFYFGRAIPAEDAFKLLPLRDSELSNRLDLISEA
ncbi:putative bifunctional diguanylate cyclase/phosphodiesterase [Roseibium limicola]|uniref:EAL domain-containing protein n=1 Tax=Roseibium limicola TaxID=2816037 RepID=A0A939ERD7_9HYPH|nr:EAL domain-containing protein [Roseibium limicola]MBO0347098.1 EAL domain-containing protein [Roseibium limicola]